jgi:hypothetical protein
MRFLFLIAALVAFVPAVHAQQAPTPLITPGDRVALPAASAGASYTATVRPRARLFGTVRAVGPDFVAFELDGSRGVVQHRPFTSLDTLEVGHRSRRAGAHGGALWGVFLGTSLGIIAGPFAGPALNLDTEHSIAALGSGGGVAGALLGAAAGAMINRPQWTHYIFR